MHFLKKSGKQLVLNQFLNINMESPLATPKTKQNVWTCLICDQRCRSDEEIVSFLMNIEQVQTLK